MLRLAVLSALGRFGTFTGALVALFAAAVLSMGWGMQLESVLRTNAPVERYASATAVVTGQQKAALGEQLSLAAAGPARTVMVVGIARPRHLVSQQTVIFLTDAEATRLAGHSGQVDAIGVLAVPGFDVSRLQAAAGGAQVLTGGARGAAEYPELERTRTVLIPVTAAFGGLAMFIAMFVVASTLGLSIQQREREIALLRAVAATPGQIRRMIAWEAAIVALAGSAAGIWPGIVLGRALAHALVRHAIAPPNEVLNYDWLPAAAAIGGGVTTALLAVLASGRRAARVPPTLALTDAAAEPRLLGPGRIVGGLIALADAVPLFAVSTTTSDPQTAVATSEINAIFLVVAAAFFGPIVAYAVARLLAPALTALSPVGGFLAAANLGAATRRFSSASTPLVLTIALSCTLFFGSTTIEHATSQQQRVALTGQLAITSAGPGLPAAALADVRATPGVRSAVALTSTTLGPSLGVPDDTPSAQILTGGQGGGLDVSVIAGSLSALHGDAIALGRHRADAAHARVDDGVAIMLGDGTPAQATVVAIYSRDLAFGDALLAPELAAGHQTTPLLNEPAGAGSAVPRTPGERQRLARHRERRQRRAEQLARAVLRRDDLHLHVDRRSQHADHDRAPARSRASAPAAQRCHHAPGPVDGALGGHPDHHHRPRHRAGDHGHRAATAQPRAHGRLPSIRASGWFAAILGVSALLALVALSVPTRRALRTQPVEAIGIRE